jgi:hypothetical protein
LAINCTLRLFAAFIQPTIITPIGDDNNGDDDDDDGRNFY